MVEPVNGQLKAELIDSRRIWESTEAFEIATMGWVHWWNNAHVNEALGYRTREKAEATYTHDQETAPVAS